jgi:hypothetical protein
MKYISSSVQFFPPVLTVFEAIQRDRSVYNSEFVELTINTIFFYNSYGF